MPQTPQGAYVAKTAAGVLVPLNVDDDGNLLVSGPNGGEAVSVADGADVAQGAKADAAWPGTGVGTVIAILKALWISLSGYTPKNYAANNAGDLLKTGAGVLGGFSVNTAGLTSTLTLYDGTTTGGTKIGTFSTLAINSLQMRVAFSTGLFAVLAGGTPADVTVYYK